MGRTRCEARCRGGVEDSATAPGLSLGTHCGVVNAMVVNVRRNEHERWGGSEQQANVCMDGGEGGREWERFVARATGGRMRRGRRRVPGAPWRAGTTEGVRSSFVARSPPRQPRPLPAHCLPIARPSPAATCPSGPDRGRHRLNAPVLLPRCHRRPARIHSMGICSSCLGLARRPSDADVSLPFCFGSRARSRAASPLPTMC